MKQFRVVRVMKMPFINKGHYGYETNEKKFLGKWLDLKNYTINDLKEIANFNNQSLQRGIIKTWYLEYRG